MRAVHSTKLGQFETHYDRSHPGNRTADKMSRPPGTYPGYDAAGQNDTRSAHRGCGADRGSLAVHSRFADQTRREPALSTVLCRSNGLSGSRLDISRVGDRRIDCLGCDDEVVSCRDIPHDKRAAAHDLLHARNRQMGQLVAVLGCILWFALNGFLWYARPSPIAWLLGSALLGIVFFAAFFWYLARNSDPHHN